MKRTLFFTTTIILLLSSTSCTKVEKEYFPNGHPKSEIEYRFGKENGTATYYFKHGLRPKIVVEMKKGMKHGKMHHYFFDGSIKSESTFIRDIQEGIERTYDQRGNPVSEITFVNGKKNGPYTTWHERDMIKEKGFFKEDLFDGEWEYYDERGAIVGEGSFVQGTGSVTSYDQAGNLYRITHYINNLKDGDDIFYLPNGEVDKVIFYQEDRIVKINGEPVSIENSDE